MRRLLTASFLSYTPVCLLAVVCILMTSSMANAGVAQKKADLVASARPAAEISLPSAQPDVNMAIGAAVIAAPVETTLPRAKKTASDISFIYACGAKKRVIAGFLILPISAQTAESSTDETPLCLYDRSAPTEVAVVDDADADYEVCSVDTAAADAEDAYDDPTPVDEELVAAIEEMAAVEADPASLAPETVLPETDTHIAVASLDAADMGVTEGGVSAADNPVSDETDPALAETDIIPGSAITLLETNPAPFVPVVMNRSVEMFIKYFQTRGRKHFVKWLSRSPAYMPMLQGILRENGLPEDIFYIALIESGLNPKAKSHAKAVGMWQFIKGTGKKFGLRIDWWIDERMDPEKATHAAAKYFQNLYDEFDSWYLAAAGYNAGEGRVRSAVRKHRTTDFWQLASHKRPLRRETREYVPKYLAAMLIAKDPQGYGFDSSEIEAFTGNEYDRVNIPAPTDLNVIAEAAGTTAAEIQRLNPELLRWHTPPNYPDYMVKIPLGSKEQFVENFSKIPAQELLVYRMHTIKRGDTLSTIAKRYGTDIKAIVKLNNLKSVKKLKIGETLAIPVPPEFGERKKIRAAQSKDRNA